MTDLRINQLIAEHCGWKFIAFDIGWHVVGDFEVKAKIPDYCNDLNIMRKAELSLSKEIYDEYWNQLAFLCIDEEESMVSSSSKLRAKAFVKTIGKWKN